MLKIKDNVDLKELEKFGFEYFINGCVSEYIVPFEDKKYKVTIVDDVLKNPLYINQIEKWEEMKDE